jgi:ubiquinol-cytochrome c reductase cytochrome c1 subunit
MMKKLIPLLIAGLSFGALAIGAQAEEGALPAKPISYSFEGPFGKFDKAQLQRGYKVYKEVCSTCHSMKFVAFRNLADKGGPGFNEEQVKVLAATAKYSTVNDQGETVERAGLASDYFPSPYANEEAAKAANGGAVPPDLSLITKAREGWHGTFNQLWNNIGGPQYVYSLLTGYDKVPDELVAEQKANGKYYNPYFVSGHWISMPTAGTLVDGAVTFDDGSKNTVDDMARDVSAFLAWTAEPKMEERKQTGFEVMIYLAILAGLLYFLKRHVWRDVH